MSDVSTPRSATPHWSSEIGAGLMVGLVCLPLSTACGLLVYAPLGPGYVAAGAAAGLYGGAVVGILCAILATSSFIITTARVSMALVQAGLTSGLVGNAAFAGHPTLIITAVMLCLLFAGIWQILFGVFGVAGVIKFAPHPVLTGLLNGVGALTILSQVKPFFRGGAVMWPDHPAMLVFAVLLALLILNYPAIVVRLKLPAPFGKIPGSLAGFLFGTAAYFFLTDLLPIDLGPTIGNLNITFPPDSPLLPLIIREPDASLVSVLPEILVVSIVLAIISTVESLLAYRAAQNLDDIEIHPVRDLSAQGIANCVAALAGGVGGSAIPSALLIAYRLGGRTRVTGIIAGLSLVVATFFLSGMLAELPRVVFVAVLLVIGVILFDRWNIELIADVLRKDTPLVRRHAINDFMIVLVVMGFTIFKSVVAGVVVGFLLSGLIFIINMSRPLIRRTFRGRDIFSKRIRSSEDQELLQNLGARRVVLQLEGAMFFGNADSIARKVKQLYNEAEIVVLDMRGISDLDVSGANVLRRLLDKSRDCGKRLVLCNVRPTPAAIIGNVVGNRPDLQPLTQDLDTALEWSEDYLLDRAAGGRTDVALLPLDQIDFFEGLPAEEMAELEKVLTRRDFKRAQTLCREGDAGDRMWLIMKGSVSVRITTDDGEERRIAGLGRGTTVGEMALVESVPRSATIVADEDVVCYELSRAGFDMLLNDYPLLASRILGNLARELTRRLRRTSQDLRFSNL
ncbi:MAG: cyclic nucleotide-binding domain-containing protein [Xanthobacteraceae bacterium]|nr:cyclic nucleotide-binding domain-containing protein [Xanthobacteraceae bacterium]